MQLQEMGLKPVHSILKAFEADSADISDKSSLYGGNADYNKQKGNNTTRIYKKSYELQAMERHLCSLQQIKNS